MFESLEFNIAECEKELLQFGELLQRKIDLKESDDILPFFKKHLHLSAFIACNVPNLSKYDRIKHECKFSKDFQADLVIGDSRKHAYCFVEFENGQKNSIFKKGKRQNAPEWSRRFEEGYSQIIDWFWKLDDIKNTSEVRRDFGSNSFTAHGILVIGRTQYLSDTDKERLKWRSNKVVVDSHIITCLTFDMLYNDMKDKLEQTRQLREEKQG